MMQARFFSNQNPYNFRIFRPISMVQAPPRKPKATSINNRSFQYFTDFIVLQNQTTHAQVTKKKYFQNFET